MKSLNPSCKLIGLLAVTFIVAFVHNPIINLCIFAICMILTLTSGVKIRSFLIPMIPVMILAVGMFFTGYRFTRASTVVNTASLHLKDSHVWNGLIFSSRVVVYFSIGILFAMTTDRIRMIRSFEKQLHMPQLFAYGILAAWGLFPKMAEEYKRTRLAFRARGIHVSAASPSLLATLMVKSTQWSEALSIAMESRGFSGHETRSSYQPEQVRKADIAFLLITCALFPLAVFLLFHFGIL